MFKKGDWIIATKEFTFSAGGIDRSYMNDAILVIDVTPHHIVFESHRYNYTSILPMDRIINQQFILAEPSIIAASKRLYNSNQIQQEEKEYQISGWDEW